jgi:hypothetical protein
VYRVGRRRDRITERRRWSRRREREVNKTTASKLDDDAGFRLKGLAPSSAASSWKCSFRRVGKLS